MDTTVIVLIVVVVLLVIGLAAAGVMLSRRRRSERLQEHYGTEYDRALAETGDPRQAEAELTERERRRRSLDVRDLQPDERDRFGEEWTTIQRGFVDDPVQAVRHADGLVVEIMRTRGYPVDDFEQRAADISVEHPDVVQRYRDARVVRDATEDGSADTEQQRHAVTSYRALVDALLGGSTHTGHAERPTPADDESAHSGTPSDYAETRTDPADRTDRDERTERTERDDTRHDDTRTPQGGRHSLNGHRSTHPTPEETR